MRESEDRPHSTQQQNDTTSSGLLGLQHNTLYFAGAEAFSNPGVTLENCQDVEILRRVVFLSLSRCFTVRAATLWVDRMSDFRHRAPFVAILWLGLLLMPAQASADEPYVHVVYKGQRLGSIAKRYNVSISELCEANGISRKAPIRPGQKLIIPGKSQKPTRAKPAPTPKQVEEPAPEARAKTRSNPRPPRKHKVYKGQRLGSIARRYNVSVDAICHASGIRQTDPIHPGDTLLIPGRGDETGSYARQLRLKGQVSVVEKPDEGKTPKQRASLPQTWRKYQKAPWKRGYVTLVGFNHRWKGYVIGPDNRVLPKAREEVSKVLSATGERPRIHRRLIELLAKVSDTFGGRPLRVVSGYRERSYSAASRHRTGRALDFSVPGVPNEVVRDYLRSFEGVGVGYYPNSTFVHLDVRDVDTYWIDYSGPGQAPDYRRGSSQDDGE